LVVFNTTFSNISVILWWSVLLVEETGVPRENHRPQGTRKSLTNFYHIMLYTSPWGGFEPTTCRGHDRTAVGFATTYAISAYHHRSCEFESPSWRGVLDRTLCDKVCQWLAICLFKKNKLPRQVESGGQIHVQVLGSMVLPPKHFTVGHSVIKIR
jgi:hypothetical protein